MKKIFIRSPFILFFMGAVFFTIETRASELQDSIPLGWRKSLSSSADVVIGTDTTVKHGGKTCAFLQRIPNPSYSAGSLLQSIIADPYRNKRVRMSVYVKSKDVETGFLYMRVDGPDTSLTFANNKIRPIEETTDWILYQITLDVPEEGVNIDFGAALMGQGTLWVDDYSLEIVDRSVPSDDMAAKGTLQRTGIKNPKRIYQPNAKAMNLGFEDH